VHVHVHVHVHVRTGAEKKSPSKAVIESFKTASLQGHHGIDGQKSK
jgi:hypothetical protein